MEKHYFSRNGMWCKLNVSFWRLNFDMLNYDAYTICNVHISKRLQWAWNYDVFHLFPHVYNVSPLKWLKNCSYIESIATLNCYSFFVIHVEMDRKIKYRCLLRPMSFIICNMSNIHHVTWMLWACIQPICTQFEPNLLNLS